MSENSNKIPMVTHQTQPLKSSQTRQHTATSSASSSASSSTSSTRRQTIRHQLYPNETHAENGGEEEEEEQVQNMMLHSFADDVNDQESEETLNGGGQHEHDDDPMNPQHHNQNHVSDLVESSASSFDAAGTRTLIEFFVSIGQPMSVFDNFRLRSFVAELNPAYVLPSSHTVEFDYLPELVSILEYDLRQTILSVEHVAITTSTFKSNENNCEYTGS